jgi:hypothetical protein
MGDVASHHASNRAPGECRTHRTWQNATADCDLRATECARWLALRQQLRNPLRDSRPALEHGWCEEASPPSSSLSASADSVGDREDAASIRGVRIRPRANPVGIGARCIGCALASRTATRSPLKLSTLARKFGDVFGEVRQPSRASRRGRSTSRATWQGRGG